MELFIARDKDGCLCLSESEFIKKNVTFVNSDSKYIRLDPSWFPEITFENSPQKIKLNLI